MQAGVPGALHVATPCTLSHLGFSTPWAAFQWGCSVSCLLCSELKHPLLTTTQGSSPSSGVPCTPGQMPLAGWTQLWRVC